jgi:hypothetical protein
VNDGFNYHTVADAAPYAVEIDCIGRDNGASSDTDNGTAMHDAGSVVRLNGEYYSNVGTNVHDINTDTTSWNLGVNAHDSTSAVNDINFAVGWSTGAAGKMWLDCCKSSGSATDFHIQAGANGYIRNFVSGGAYSGAPGAY